MIKKFALFETVLGRAAIGWTESGVCRLHLPESTDEDTIEFMQRKLGSVIEEKDPPGFIREATHKVAMHLAGKAQDLSSIPLDLHGLSQFQKNVLNKCRQIPSGSVLSYSDLALAIGKPKAARAVGGALASNPIAIIVPCHRVFGKNGAMTGFSAYGSCNTKLRLLSIEHALSSDAVLCNQA